MLARTGGGVLSPIRLEHHNFQMTWVVPYGRASTLDRCDLVFTARSAKLLDLRVNPSQRLSYCKSLATLLQCQKPDNSRCVGCSVWHYSIIHSRQSGLLGVRQKCRASHSATRVSFEPRGFIYTPVLSRCSARPNDNPIQRISQTSVSASH